MVFSEVLDRYTQGELSDEALAGYLQAWLEEIEQVYGGVEALPEHSLSEEALTQLEECNESLNQLGQALDDEEYDRIEELVPPTRVLLEQAFATLAALRASRLPEPVADLLEGIEALLAGELSLAEVEALFTEVESMVENLRQAETEDLPEEAQGLHLKAIAHLDQGLQALQQAVRAQSAEKLELGRELLLAANATLVQLQAGEKLGS